MTDLIAAPADPCGEAAELFLRLSEPAQDAILELIRSLLSEQAREPAAPASTDRTEE